MNDDYRTSVDEKRMLMIRSLLSDLPRSCGDFIRNITATTSTLTRLAYVYDFGIFFRYIQQECARLGGKEPALYTDEDLSLLTGRDIEGYVEYLTTYYKNIQNENGEFIDSKLYTNHECGIMRKLSSLRSFFEYLFQRERIPGNIATLVPLPKLHQKPILRLEEEEAAKMLRACLEGDELTERQKSYQKITVLRDYAILMVFLGTGIRVSECVGLNIEDVDFEQNAFLVTRKGGNAVILYFPDEVADALKNYIAQRETIEILPGHESALFLSLQRRRITQRAVENLVKKYALIAAPLKKHLSPHKMRATYATNLYRETGDIYLVADALGHSNVNTTRKHYADMTQDRRRQAAQHVKLPDVIADENKPESDD